MNSWTNQNNVVGSASFSPYNTNVPYNLATQMYNKPPVYRADPIHGMNAAWQFPMGPNSEIYLPDADMDVIWWIRTDMNGNKSVQKLNVVFPEEPEQVDLNKIIERLNALEERVNAKQNKSNAKRSSTSIDDTTAAN